MPDRAGQTFKIIAHLLPTQRGNVKIPNIQVINAILYIAEHGCKWRGLPEKFGYWHSIYMRVNRWAKKGVLDHIFIVWIMLTLLFYTSLFEVVK